MTDLAPPPPDPGSAWDLDVGAVGPAGSGPSVAALGASELRPVGISPGTAGPEPGGGDRTARPGELAGGPVGLPAVATPPSAPSPLPPAAMARLSATARPGAARLFTSNLTVNEFALVQECGFTPVGMVVGTAMYHVGLEPGSWPRSAELGELSQALYTGRALAVARLEAEADALGADGIVGIRLHLHRHEGADDVVEFVATGTAVASVTGGSWRTPLGRPFTSELSGQEFWMLVRTGHMPIALVFGVCVYHVDHAALRDNLLASGRHSELPAYTQALFDARELALARLQQEATDVSADGIVGVRVETATHTWGAQATEFLATGTAVRAFPLDVTLPSATLVMPVVP